MANTTLREFVREIERYLDSGKYEDALTCCHHLLETFPKHIETYRLLAKTFIETKQTSNAELIFEKVLQVYPDDFISHLGLSIILEEKGDLNNSVLHMERAFEIQPSNINIQDELKRLYKARDGVEPNRIRLTRGALIRMYARSNLFTQAISEIQIALHEHPQRIDLELILAKMLILSNQKIEAVEQCIQIVSKQPYCFEANKILSDTLSEASEAHDVQIFRQRLIELDPYYKFTSVNQPDVYSVPDVAVSINQIETQQVESVDSIDWSSLIEKYWLDTDKSFTELRDEEEINWDEIIEKHFEIDTTTEKDEIVTSNTTEESPSLVSHEIHDEEAIDLEPSETEKLKDKDNKILEDIPEWLQIDDNEIKSTDKNIEPFIEHSDEEESSGLVDADIPVNPEFDQEESKPPSIWINDINAESTNLSIDESDTITEEEKQVSGSEDEKVDGNQSQYYQTLLKDAHDTLLSGLPKRSLECYQELLQGNQLIEEMSIQLEQDLNQFPENPPLWLILGDALQKLGEFEQALEIYKKAESQFNISSGGNE